MDLDLSEYDQVDEVKYGAWRPQAMFACQNINTNSNSGNSNNKDANLTAVAGVSSSTADDSSGCENDFVFLPAPPSRHEPTESERPNNSMTYGDQSLATPTASLKDLGADCDQNHSKLSPFGFRSTQQTINNKVFVRPELNTSLPLSTRNANLSTINNSNNPFDNNANCHMPQPIVGSPSKPIGLLEVSSSVNVAGATSRLDDLLHQIVTRSDLIYIAIPCAYCHEPIACPPSDISAWLNHMSRAHNCKACPICNKMIGLGPRRDIEIMRKHVLAHLDDDWLNRRAAKTNFTFGLQQQWFSGSRCTVKDAKFRY